MTQTQSDYNRLPIDLSIKRTISCYTTEKLSRRNTWLHEKVFCIPNKKLDSTTKLVVFALSQWFVHKGIPHQHPIKIWYQDIQDRTGLSDDAVSTALVKLARARAIIKETKKVPSGPTGEKKRRVFISFTPEFLTDPGSLFAEVEDRNHGGKRTRKIHKGCGGEIVNLCTTCGQSHIPDSEVELLVEVDGEVSEPEPDAKRTELQRMDEYIAATDHYYDAAEIDDDVVDAFGGPEQALKASNREIAEMMSKPVNIRNGVSDEEMDAAYEMLREMKDSNPEDIKNWWG